MLNKLILFIKQIGKNFLSQCKVLVEFVAYETCFNGLVGICFTVNTQLKKQEKTIKLNSLILKFGNGGEQDGNIEMKIRLKMETSNLTLKAGTL